MKKFLYTLLSFIILLPSLALADTWGSDAQPFEIDTDTGTLTTDAQTPNLNVLGDLTVTGSITSGGISLGGDLDMSTNIITNIGNAGTDFVAGGGLNLDGKLDTDTTLAAGASAGHLIKTTLGAGDTYTGTTAGLTVKNYDADATVTHSGGENSGLAIFYKQLSAMVSGGESSIATLHTHADTDQKLAAGMFLYPKAAGSAFAVRAATVDYGYDLADASNVIVTTADFRGHEGEIIFNDPDGTWDFDVANLTTSGTVTTGGMVVGGDINFDGNDGINIDELKGITNADLDITSLGTGGLNLTSGNSKIILNGKVGIGNSTASHLLSVGDDMGGFTSFSAISLIDADGDAQQFIGASGTNHGRLIWNRTNKTLSIQTEVDNTVYADTIVLDSGKVGIGTASPSAELDVVGTIESNVTGAGANHLTFNETGGGSTWNLRRTSSTSELGFYTSVSVDRTFEFKNAGTGNLIISQDALKRGASSEAVADDAYIDLPSATSGWGYVMAGDNEEFARFRWTTAGVVTLDESTTNVVSTDTDANLCIFDNGTSVRIRNRLGASKTIKYVINY